MAKILEGDSYGQGLRLGIVVSRFNEFVTRSMLDGALNELRRAPVREADITVVWVPGAREIPVAGLKLVENEKPDAIIALGCIIRGETSHYEHIAQSVSDGIQRVALEKKVPVGFGVLTVETMEQAMERAGGKFGNRGRDTARSALEMARLVQLLEDESEKEKTLERLIEDELKR